MSYQDKMLTCASCGQPFTFSAAEQAFHAQRGYANEPKRCPTCREARRQNDGENAHRIRQLFPAVCAQCGRDTEVPFQPRGDRPVYCADCYSRQTLRR